MNDLDPKELDAEADASRVTKIGILRKLYPAIDRKLREGRWTAREVVEWLGKRCGLEMSVEHFRVYLRDLDRENGFVRSKKRTTNQPAPRKTQIQQSKPAVVVSRAQQSSNEGGKPTTLQIGKHSVPVKKQVVHSQKPDPKILE